MFLFLQSDKGFLYYPIPTRDSLLSLSHKIPSLFQFDKRLFISSKDFFIIPVRQIIILIIFVPKYLLTRPVRQQIFAYYPSLNKYALSFQSGRILFDSHPKTTFTIPIRQTILYDSYPITCSLLFPSDKRFVCVPLSQDFFTIPFRQSMFYHLIPLSKESFIIPVRQRILYYSSLKGFLYHSLA